MAVSTEHEPVFVRLIVEAAEGQGGDLNSVSTLLTMNAAMKAEMDERDLKFDGLSGRDIAKEQYNKRNKLTFDTPFSFPDIAGTTSALGNLFRVCGFDSVADPVAKTVIYTPSNINLVDSAYAKVFSDEVNSGAGHLVESASKGIRGTFDLDIIIGERLMLKNVTLQGTYIKPAQVPIVTADYGTQINNISADVEASTVTVCTLGGHPLCMESFSPKNVGGLEIAQSRTSCADATTASEATPQGTLVYQKPDFDTEFDPYSMSDTSNGTQEFAFVCEINSPNKGKFRFECGRVQVLHPERTALKNKKSGFSQAMLFLGEIKLTESEAD